MQTSAIAIVPKQPEYDQAIVDLRAKVYPQAPPTTLDLYRFWQTLDHLHPESLVERYVLLQNDQFVGNAQLDRYWGLERPGGYGIDIRVDPEARGQGLGGRALDFLQERLAQLEAQRVYGGVIEDDEYSMRFATNRGFTPTGPR